MLFFYTLITALLLAVGQSLWKSAANGYTLLINNNHAPVKALFTTLFGVKFMGGALLYVIATLLYLWLFSKYPFYMVQIGLVSLSLVLSVIISKTIFNESMGTTTIIGIMIIILGVFLATWKN